MHGSKDTVGFSRFVRYSHVVILDLSSQVN
jgi:hypothetical protein